MSSVFGDRSRALVAEHRDAVDQRDVDRVAEGVVGDVAAGRDAAVAAAEHRGDRQAEALLGEVGERRQQAAVDLAGADFDPVAVGEFDAARRRGPGAAAPPWRAAGRRRR